MGSENVFFFWMGWNRMGWESGTSEAVKSMDKQEGALQGRRGAEDRFGQERFLILDGSQLTTVYSLPAKMRIGLWLWKQWSCDSWDPRPNLD